MRRRYQDRDRDGDQDRDGDGMDNGMVMGWDGRMGIGIGMERIFRKQLTASATRNAMSNRVGKSSLAIKLFTEGILSFLLSLERCRQTRFFTGVFGPSLVT
jgi:hypothetical protein